MTKKSKQTFNSDNNHLVIPDKDIARLSLRLQKQFREVLSNINYNRQMENEPEIKFITLDEIEPDSGQEKSTKKADKKKSK